MKDFENIETIDDILSREREMVPSAEKDYPEAFANASGFNNLLNNFLKEANSESWIFMLFLSQVKKYHTLALFSAARLHHIQAMLNLRQVLEAGANAAYGLANPIKEDFIVVIENDLLDAPKSLEEKRRKWLKKNHEKHSDFIRNMKKSINISCAHSNMIYAFQNFSMANYQFDTPFFDFKEDHRVEADFWLISNIAMSIMDLFYGINKEAKRVTFIDDFVSRLKKLENDNHALKSELQKHPRFQILVTHNR